MDVIQTLVMFRGIERLIILLGAISTIILGALVFRWGVSGKASLIAEAKEFKFQLVNASPGILLALFGTVVLGYALYKNVSATSEASTIENDIKPKNITNSYIYTGTDADPIPSLLRRIAKMDMAEADTPDFRSKLATLKRDAERESQKLIMGPTKEVKSP